MAQSSKAARASIPGAPAPSNKRVSRGPTPRAPAIRAPTPSAPVPTEAAPRLRGTSRAPATSGPGIDCPGEWFIADNNTTVLVIGQERALTIDNTTSPPTVSVNGVPINPGGDLWEYNLESTTVNSIRPSPTFVGVPAFANLLVANPISTASTEGSGKKCMFDAVNAAFRAGQVTVAQWDNASRGPNSAAFGLDTVASGGESFAAGSSVTAAGPQSAVLGCVLSSIDGSSNHAVICGGTTNSITTGSDSFIAGGQAHQLSAPRCAAIGGSGAIISALSSVAVGCAGATISAPAATMIASTTSSISGAGLYNAIAASVSSTITAGSANFLAGTTNSTADASDTAALGGASLQVHGSRCGALGGNANSFAAGSTDSAIVGGTSNSVAATGVGCGVLGGGSNQATAARATVVGGTSNIASGVNATALGGSTNIASGLNAATLGGTANTASGADSIACGSIASSNGKANTFVWSDGNGFTIPGGAVGGTVWWATGNNATGLDPAFTIYTNSARTTGMQLFGGGAAWVAISDVNRKEHLEELKYADVLERVESLPIWQFNYKDTPEDQLYRGPTAQDWHERFPSGKYPLGIDTLDFDGITLAALKGLANRVRSLTKEVSSLKATLGQPLLS